MAGQGQGYGYNVNILVLDAQCIAYPYEEALNSVRGPLMHERQKNTYPMQAAWSVCGQDGVLSVVGTLDRRPAASPKHPPFSHVIVGAASTTENSLSPPRCRWHSCPPFVVLAGLESLLPPRPASNLPDRQAEPPRLRKLTFSAHQQSSSTLHRRPNQNCWIATLPAHVRRLRIRLTTHPSTLESPSCTRQSRMTPAKFTLSLSLGQDDGVSSD